MNLIDEIKSRINIVDLAVQLGLKPTKNDFIYSVFKSEKNRSMKLYRKTNSFYDYSTGNHGDVINLYATVKKINNESAIKVLAEDMGLINHYKNNGNGKLKEEKGIIINLERKIEMYHSFEKFCNGVDEVTLKYLKGPKRGLIEETIKRFRLFSIADVNRIIDNLLSNFHIDELKAAGLFNEKGRFVFNNNRLIIPYLDDDKIIYLRGRIISEDDNVDNKYIGLAGQPAKRLFNLTALKNLNEDYEILVCEGEFDTMMAEQKGYKAVGVPGVNNYPDDIKEILKNCEPVLCFDNDKPGKEGMQAITNKVEKKITGIFLRQHKDITDYFCLTNSEKFRRNGVIDYKILEPERKSKLNLVSAREVQKMDLPPIRWVIKNLLPEGLSILAARPKTGKSFLAQNISLSITRGTKALGFFETEQTSVLYIALEDNFRRIQDRINNIIQNEIEKTAPDNLFYLEENKDLPKINDGGIEELQKLIIDKPEIKLIIVDTFGRTIADKRRNDNNSYRADYEIASKLQEFAIQNHICVLLIHHTKKVQEEDVFNEISGTSGITGAMDTMLVLKKKGKSGKLYVTGRDVKDIEYNLVFDENICCWNVVEEEINTTAERKEIYDLIKSSGREMKTGEIAELLGKTVPNVSKMLGKMLKEGLVATEKTGHYFIPEDKKGKGFTVKRISLFDDHKDGESG
ncbi:MAG TPA: hypothetical protein DHV28_11255 [Ignavibacteriales bacterium]|nr:hypothetical protein [Ignavibacteriales bacterium]